MPLFANIEELKELVPAITTGAEFDTLAPVISHVEKTLLADEIGIALYQALLNDYNASLADTPTPMPAAMEALLSYCRAAVAPFAALQYKELLLQQLSDGGATERVADSGSPARMWVNELQTERLSAQGYEALDLLLRFIEENITDYPDYASSAPYQRLSALLMQTTAQFQACVDISNSPRLFRKLIPDISFAEETYITQAIGEELYDRLVTGKNNNNLTDEEKTALDLCRKVIANRVIAESQFPITLGPGGAYIIEYEAQYQGKKHNAPDGHSLYSFRKTHASRADVYLDRLIKYLNATASGSVLAEYYNSELYENPSAAEDQDNINDSLTNNFVM